MQKRSYLLAVLIVFLGNPAAYAGDSQEGLSWGSFYSPGNITPSISGSIEFSSNNSEISLGVYPGLEVILAKPRIMGFGALDFGLELGGRLGLPLRNSEMSVGPYLVGTMHFGLLGLGLPASEFLENIDFFSGLGLGVDIHSQNGLQFRLCVYSGINYFLNERVAVGLQYRNWGSMNGVGLSLRTRLGSRPAINGMSETWARGRSLIASSEEAAALIQFYAVFIHSFYPGGWIWFPETQKEGNGTRWAYTSSGERFTLERVLIQRNQDGSTWWRIALAGSGEDYIWEFKLNPESVLEVLRWKDSRGVVRTTTLEKTGENSTESAPRPQLVMDESLFVERYRTVSRETVNVPAGTWRDCTVVTHEDEGSQYTWWICQDKNVPGRVLQYRIIDSEGELFAKLEKLITGSTENFLLGNPIEEK